jgi:hypothetical protein
VKVKVEYTKDDILRLIKNDLDSRFRNCSVQTKDIAFEVITKQNYRSAEWERGDFRGNVVVDV